MASFAALFAAKPRAAAPPEEPPPDSLFEGKKKKFKLAVQAAKVDASDAITSLRADLAGYEGPEELAKFWNISTKAGLLYTMAEERGLEADRIVRDMMQRAQDEGPNCEKELHDLLLFNGSLFSRDTQGSTPQGRMEARLNLLIELDKQVRAHPDRRLEACVFDIAVSSDKILIAQSHAFANITPYAESLFEMAQNRGLDASAITTEIFMRAVGEGRASVEALHDLLEFKEGFWLNDETRLSSQADRMETRLELLQELKETLDGNHLTSVKSVSLDLARVSKKVEVAQDKQTTRQLEGEFSKRGEGGHGCVFSCPDPTPTPLAPGLCAGWAEPRRCRCRPLPSRAAAAL